MGPNTMDATLVKALIALVPVGLLFAGSILLFARGRTTGGLLQLIGAVGLVAAVFAHRCEALRLFPSMGWGEEHSLGHYIDLAGACLGGMMFPIGYFVSALARRRDSRGR